MDDPISLLKTPKDCEQFASNVEGRNPELAKEARRRAVQLRAAGEGAKNALEQDCWEAVHAYERTLYKKHGKVVRASYTRRMIKDRGLVAGVEHTVLKTQETQGFRALLAEGMEDMAFEAVVLRHTAEFSADAVLQSKLRLDDWKKNSS